MFKRLAILIGLMALSLNLGLAQPAAAQATIGSNATGDEAALSDSFPMPGQVVRAPGWVGPLTQYSFWIRTGSASLTVTPVIYEWDNLTPVGAPIWTGGPVTVTSSTFVETVFPTSVVLDPSKTYWLAVAQTNPGEFGWVQGGSVNDYADGYYTFRRAATFDWGRSLGAELRFSGLFVDPVLPPGIPTLSQWASILLGLMLAGGAALHLNRRRRAST